MKSLQQLLHQIKMLPCYVAYPSVITYECRVDNLCEACSLRMEINDIYVDSDTIDDE